MSSLFLQSYAAKTWYKILSWNSATDGTYLICAKAYDSASLISQSTCYTVIVGTPIPVINQTTVFPTGMAYPSSGYFIFTCQYLANVTKPTSLAYIYIYEQTSINNTNDTLVYKVNSGAPSTTTFFNDTWMTFRIPIGALPSGYFYILFDYGVAVGTVLCKPISPAITDPTFWTFQINNTLYTTTTTTQTTTLTSNLKSNTSVNSTTNCMCNISSFMFTSFLILGSNLVVHYTVFVGIFSKRESFFKLMDSVFSWIFKLFKRSKVLFKRVAIKSKITP